MINQSVIVYIFLLICTAFAEEVQWHYCNPVAEKESQCTIQHVQVSPCKEAANNLPCKLKRAKDAQITFNYTPNFNADNVTSQAYWDSGIVDIPLVGMNTVACENTKCPIVKGESNTYNIKLHMDRLFPAKEFKVKWRLWNKEQQECCFTIMIRLT